MNYDVVVVGSGIGGLTAAALLATRGVNVCVFERNSQVGGCIRRIEYSGFDFEPGMGIYTGWARGEIYDQIFSELSVRPPETHEIESDYVVRLADGVDVQLRKDPSEFFDELRRAFPESAAEAVSFYQSIDVVSGPTILDHIKSTSSRFQRFIDAQLRAFIQTPLEHCALSAAQHALNLPRQKHYSIQGGPATLAESLAEAIRSAGGRVKLDSPVLRLAYDESGKAIGIDLLSGERVIATRAIISNMTIWDTYGKLVGLNRTPPEIKKQLATFESSGAYLIYATVDESAMTRLPAERFLVCSNESDDSLASSDITFATSSVRSTSGKRAATLTANCPVNEWFTFQSSPEDFEEWDQSALEILWTRLHQALPELGQDIEIIETANPRTFYEDTRRKLGMVMGIAQPTGLTRLGYQTTLPNVFMLGDTVSLATLPTVSQTALALSNHLIN